MRRRVVVISDIHLSDAPPYMMSRPKALAAFVRKVADARREGEQCELVIAGDFVDFLALSPQSAFVADPQSASEKLRAVFANDNRAVADALGQAVRDGVRLTVLAGNHDLELCHPMVQATLAELCGLEAEDGMRFITHGEAYRAGGLLIEHGNRYDRANENDWDGVRALVSSLSRGTASFRREVVTYNPAVQPSPGSQLVAEVINNVRSRYPFVPLLQPEGVLTALLLRVLEPSLHADWDQIVAILRARRAQGGRAPGQIRNIGGCSDPLDAELEAAFGDDYARLVQLEPAVHDIGARDWVKLFLATREDSLAERLRRGEPLSTEVLRCLQIILRQMDLGTGAYAPDGPTGECGARARLMIEDPDVQTVVMGHTHAARSVGQPDRATYINTGTWCDIVSVPPRALEQTEKGLDRLCMFLHRLCRDDPSSRDFVPTFADITLDGTRVVQAKLCRDDDGPDRGARNEKDRQSKSN